MAQSAGLAAGTASAFSALSEVQDISSNAQALIDRADGKLGPVQWVFLGSVLVMQLTQIWVKKAS